MSNQPKTGDISPQAANGEQEGSSVAVGWVDKIKEQYMKTKENAETYPYVWGSYILVYGGFGLWLAYRWRKLRQTEDRVRALQEEIRKQFEAEQSAMSAGVVEESAKSESLAKKLPPAADKVAK